MRDSVQVEEVVDADTLRVLLDTFGKFFFSFSSELDEVLSEEVSEQHSDQVETFLAVVVTVIFAGAAKRRVAEAVDHVADEESFFRVGVLVGSQVWQQLFLQNHLSMLESLCFGGQRTGADEGFSALGAQVVLGFSERTSQQLHHRCIFEIVADMFEDVSVRHHTECTEDDHQRNNSVDVSDRAADRLKHLTLVFSVEVRCTGSSFAKAERKFGRWFIGTLMVRPDLSFPGVAADFFVVEDVDEIVGHLLLSEDNLFASFDNEVASLIEVAFSCLYNFSVGHSTERAVLGSNHDGDFTDRDLLHKFVSQSPLFTSLLVVVVDPAPDIHEQLRFIGEVSESGFVRVHVMSNPVLVSVGWFLVDMQLLELELIGLGV